jgi:bifunctional ADP-heptose synthase (sugar kinase/adenylyltransferase)
MTSPRSGILAAGNFIVDYVKIVDHYPQQDMLASILGESQANGGGPYNVLKDLAAMQAAFPLAACGLVGDDANGRWIRNVADPATIARPTALTLPNSTAPANAPRPTPTP